MDRDTELELIERHLQGAGATRLPTRQAFQTSARTEAQQARTKRWNAKFRFGKQAQIANRSP